MKQPQRKTTRYRTGKAGKNRFTKPRGSKPGFNYQQVRQAMSGIALPNPETQQ